MPSLHERQRPSVPALKIGLLIVAATLACGCRPEETIRSYTVPKASGTAVSAASDRTMVPSHRMLALIVPSDSQVWFLKLVGKLDRVDPQADAIRAFLAGVKIEGDRPTWRLPDDWTEAPPSRMRLATINIPGGLEISVIGLPRTGDWDAQLLDNVNRWRGQLGLPPTGAPALAGFTEPVDDLQDAVIVDLRGAFSDSMGPPFAGGALPPHTTTPRATPKISAPDKLQSTPPAGWVDLGTTGLRKANLKTSNAPDAASVRAMNFTAFGQMADPLANVNRWRGQVGLAPIGPAEVTELAESVTIAGEPALLFELVPEEPEEKESLETEATENKAPPMAMTAAMQKRGDQVWFFLISGPAEIVAAERANFDAWLASVRFGLEQSSNQPQEPNNGDR